MSDTQTEIDLHDGRYLNVNITHEGIVMDVYDAKVRGKFRDRREDKHLGTVGMMFDEWANWIVAS